MSAMPQCARFAVVPWQARQAGTSGSQMKIIRQTNICILFAIQIFV
jgi:hypothetical protein